MPARFIVEYRYTRSQCPGDEAVWYFHHARANPDREAVERIVAADCAADDRRLNPDYRREYRVTPIEETAYQGVHCRDRFYCPGCGREFRHERVMEMCHERCLPYVCGECRERHAELEDAQACCRQTYACRNCYSEYDDEDDALDCCREDEEIGYRDDEITEYCSIPVAEEVGAVPIGLVARLAETVAARGLRVALATL